MSKPDFAEEFEDVFLWMDSNHTKRKIVLSKETKHKLSALKRKGESYEDLIKRLLGS